MTRSRSAQKQTAAGALQGAPAGAITSVTTGPTEHLRPKTRCAVYTRKSSEEGLDMAFNSLDAQYKACCAYVTSQKQEGWVLADRHYDDGGISGGPEIAIPTQRRERWRQPSRDRRRSQKLKNR